MFVPDLLITQHGRHRLERSRADPQVGVVGVRRGSPRRLLPADHRAGSSSLPGSSTSGRARRRPGSCSPPSPTRSWTGCGSLVEALVENGTPARRRPRARRPRPGSRSSTSGGASTGRRGSSPTSDSRPIGDRQEPDPRDSGSTRDDVRRRVAAARNAPTSAPRLPSSRRRVRAAPASPAAVDPRRLPAWKVPQSYGPGPVPRALNSREERVGFARLEDGLNTAEAPRRRPARRAPRRRTRPDPPTAHRRSSGRGRRPRSSPASAPSRSRAARRSSRRRGPTSWATSGLVAVAQLRDELAAVRPNAPRRLGPATAGRCSGRTPTTSAERVVASLVTEVRLGLLNAYTSGVTTAPAWPRSSGRSSTPTQVARGSRSGSLPGCCRRSPSTTPGPRPSRLAGSPSLARSIRRSSTG